MLGPSVCLSCMKFMVMSEQARNAKRGEILIGPQWFCPNCGRNCQQEGATHLFCLTPEQAAKVTE
jgi:hypothetical protein